MLRSVHFAFLAVACIGSVPAQSQATSTTSLDPRPIVALPPLVSRGDIPAGVSSIGAVRAPAPALSDVWVYAVGSTYCGWEYTAGLSTTTCDHGGTELRVAVLEIGYGASRIASMNGGVLPRTAMYASTPVCVTDGRYTWPCTAGQTVAGFLNEYNIDGNESGYFSYQNTSSNAPWNTVYAQINIR